jgi:hypothetical protein
MGSIGVGVAVVAPSSKVEPYLKKVEKVCKERACSIVKINYLKNYTIKI